MGSCRPLKPDHHRQHDQHDQQTLSLCCIGAMMMMPYLPDDLDLDSSNEHHHSRHLFTHASTFI